MVRIEKCLHFKVKCRHNPQFVLDILPVYLTDNVMMPGSKHSIFYVLTSARTLKI